MDSQCALRRTKPRGQLALPWGRSCWGGFCVVPQHSSKPSVRAGWSHWLMVYAPMPFAGARARP
eukprot:11202887-Ditylum_brightwellii.AAC.1